MSPDRADIRSGECSQCRGEVFWFLPSFPAVVDQLDQVIRALAAAASSDNDLHGESGLAIL